MSPTLGLTVFQIGQLLFQDWAQHGICGRGVFLDLVRYYTESNTPLPYDPWTTHGISVSDLEACAREQGVTFRRSDILILRVGFIQRYNSASQAERNGLAGKPETLYVCTFAVMSVWLTDVY